MLDREIQRTIMRRFPEIKLSYNKNINRKVYADFFQIIPKGQKALLWFTYIHKKNVCLVLKLDYKGNIKEIDQFALCFENTLSYGTILYGTILRIMGGHVFCIEDSHYYKGKNIERKNPLEKLEIYKTMFDTEISQTTYTNKFIKPVLAYTAKDYNSVKQTIQTLPYKVYGIKYIRNTYSIGVEKIKYEIKHEAIFNVKPSLNSDIYNLYALDNIGNKILHNIAYIASYKKSVYMNSLFRDIKENRNLDLLEESDDDEEFENISPDRYVNLEKEIIMSCVYNNKFKKWEPIAEIDEGQIAIIKDIKYVENKV